MAAFMKLKAEDASKAIAHSQFQPETDGYMKLGDIKGEGVRNRIGIRNPMESAIKEVGWWTVDGADFRGIQQDALTKGGQEGEELVSDYWSPTPSCSIDETCTPTCATGLADDALVQQVNDSAGLINPDSMRPVDFIAQANSEMSGMAQEWFSLGSAVDSLASQAVLVKTFCTGYCVDGGSSEQENAFAPANMPLRSDNRF